MASRQLWPPAQNQALLERVGGAHKTQFGENCYWQSMALWGGRFRFLRGSGPCTSGWPYGLSGFEMRLESACISMCVGRGEVSRRRRRAMCVVDGVKYILHMYEILRKR